MTSITIYRPPDTEVVTVAIDEKSVFTKRLMGEWNIVCIFNSSSILSVQIGDFISYNSENYYINRLPDIIKLNSSTFQYKIVFEHSVYNLGKKLFISADGLAEFSYNGTAEDFITNIVASVNEIDSGWTVGTVDSSDYLTLQFSNESCKAALTRVAEAFRMEFEIISKAISLKNSIGTTQSLTFEYGQGKGLYKLTRQQVQDQNIITKVYGFGGTKNISYDYRNRAKRLVFAATGYLPEPASGYPYMTKNTDLYGIIEGQFTDDNIYPQRTSTLTSANIDYDDDDRFNPRSSYVEDSALDFDLNDYLLEGQVAKIVFKSGDIGGIECEIWKYDNANKRIYFNAYSDPDGYTLPQYNSGSPIEPKTGDSYTLVDISMPQSYIDTAEASLKTATQSFLDENCVPMVVYECDFDPKYAKSAGLDLDAGDKVTVKDTDLGVDALIRISGIEYPLVNPYKIKALIADFVPYTLQERIIKNTVSTKKETVFVDLRSIEQARRNTMRQNQMRELLFDTDGYFDPVNLKPLSIETAYLSVGTKSRDFWLSNVTIKANYEGDANAFYVSAGSLVHLQIEIAGLGYTWVIGTPLDIDSLTPASAYYLYAKCSKTELTGEWILSSSQITFEHVPGCYHFLIGMLFAVDDSRRDFDFVSGMTYINGGTITTGKIQSIDGNNYLDLTQSKFRVGDSNSSLDWNVTAANTLTIIGGLVQSGAGVTAPLPCFRGAYASGYVYYKGDEATYEGSTFRWINDTAASGQTPAEGGYWTVIAAAGGGEEPGPQGDPGNYIEYQYAKNGSTTTPPSITTTDLNPSGWSVTPPSTGALEYLWMTKATKTYDGSVLIVNWSTPVRLKGEVGATGATGPAGEAGKSPAMVFRGAYSSEVTYYGTQYRVDVVKYNNTYYVARIDAGDGFTDKVPTNTSYWNAFGASFESVATDLLLAEKAYIEKLGVRYFEGIEVGAGDLDGTVENTTANIDLETAWESDFIYLVNLRCSVAGVNYKCIQNNENKKPPNSAYWTTETPQPQKRKDTITLTGEDGQADIVCNAITSRIYFNETLANTASGFVEANASNWASSGVVLYASAEKIITEAATAGTDFSGSTTIENVPNESRGSIKIDGNDIWEDSQLNDYTPPDYYAGCININRRGYQGGFTKLRETIIYNGLATKLIHISGLANGVYVYTPKFVLFNIPSSNPGHAAGEVYYDPSTKVLKIDI